MNEPQLVVEPFPKVSMLNRLFIRLFSYFPRRLIGYFFSQQCKLYQLTLLLEKDISKTESLSDVMQVVPENAELGLLNERVFKQMIEHPEALSEQIYRKRLALGDICYYQLNDNVLVNFNWISFKSCSTYRGSEKEMPFLRLSNKQAFTYDFYTYQSYRKKGYGTLVKRYALADLAERGITTMYSSVEPENYKSLNVHLNLNFRLNNVVQNFKLMHWTFSLWGHGKYRTRVENWLNHYRSEYLKRSRDCDGKNRCK